MSARPLLDNTKIAPTALDKMSAFHASTLEEVKSAIDGNPVVVVGMAQNPFVRKARKALDAAGVTYRYLEYGNYMSQWKQRLSIKLWSGWPTFPQVFVKGELLGGFAETEAAIADGSIKQRVG